ncbi:MAG TPA: threonine synthase [Firmicutes bacterium]|uniref:threonine synthase n=1 Tax=Gelria sp. Kuro-4 TaxID=2796927 RepID=UPI0019C74B24|nr:threonine synthase [Gelria sp. Kuro-4]BCV25082.1 threonine synthase [Gelria sp. Kuro-4]HHV56319.1 threonine synthase [Bacillota bacterium]
MWQGVIEHFAAFLPVTEATPRVTLNEGNTPLIFLSRLSKRVGAEVYAKYEGLNPTGSFKDRGMTLAVSKAVEAGSTAVMCASTGNTSASAAAYAARAGLKCWVLLPEKAIALGKLAQALFYGAQVIAVQGNFDQALALVRELTARYPITLVNSLNPMRLEGQKTAAFEVCDQLGGAPDILALPVGNAGNITAYWLGFQAYYAAGRIGTLPRLWGFEAAGAAPIVQGRVVPDPQTVATAIKIGNPASWEKAVRAAAESGGSIAAVTDEEILTAYRLLAREEGIFVEPASAAGVAGVLQRARQGLVQGHEKIVCVLTGHGLKDPELAVKQSPAPQVVPATLEAVSQLIGG